MEKEKENKSLTILTEQFLKLPGFGNKTAKRFAYHIMKMPSFQVEKFSKSIMTARNIVKNCKVCGGFSDSDICGICSDESRDRTFICVVGEPKDIFSVEKSYQFKGVYHVLGGVVSPFRGIGPSDLNIEALEKKVSKNKIKEVMVATDTSIEGETTAIYLFKILKAQGVKVSRLGYGICVGADLEFADEITMSHAISGRKEML